MKSKLIKSYVIKESDGYYWSSAGCWTKDIELASTFGNPESAFSYMEKLVKNLGTDYEPTEGIEDATWPLECITIFVKDDE